jgi:hypothetical protein
MRNWKTVSTAIIVGLLTIWLAIVLFTSTRHEFWRDEVRALSIARAAHSPLDIFRIRNEGHPALWYLLLYLCKSIVDSPLVLPVLSITIAFAAVVLFLFRAPFPLWLRALFIFSALPLYEYSVMARNYGISMLLFFIAAALYRERDEHPLWLAFVLALLANTNIHSAMLVGLVAIVWMWDFVARKKAGAIQLSVLSLCFGLAIIVAGLALCLVVALPTKDTIVTRAYSVTAKQVFAALLDTVWRPQIGVLLYLLIFCLLRRVDLFLAGLGGLIGFGVFFRVAYPGSYRHQGIFLVFVLFLYWLTAESPAETTLPTKIRRWLDVGFKIGLYGALPALLLGNVYKDKVIIVDIKREMSSSQAFGAFLNQSNAYRNAIIVAEPAFFVESLPFYATNAIYLPREHRFGNWAAFDAKADPDLSLGQVLSIARDLQTQRSQPVLIVLGKWPPKQHKDGFRMTLYGRWKFSWTTNELDEADRTLTQVADFNKALTAENYKVMAFK